MSKKLLMIIIPSAALLSFGLMFGVAWLTRPTAEPQEPVDEQTQQVMQQQQQQMGMAQMQQMQPQMAPVTEPEVKSPKRMMTERQLEDLVNTAKEKIEQYDLKLAGLEREEQRIKMSQETLLKEIGDLEALRVEVADAIANLKSERKRLEQSRIVIGQNEQDNILKVAKAYAAMKQKASPLLVDMCKDLETEDGREKVRTAVKILYNIDEKTQAKILTEMVKNSPGIAGMLTMELKRVAVEPVEN